MPAATSAATSSTSTTIVFDAGVTDPCAVSPFCGNVVHDGGISDPCRMSPFCGEVVFDATLSDPCRFTPCVLAPGAIPTIAPRLPETGLGLDALSLATPAIVIGAILIRLTRRRRPTPGR